MKKFKIENIARISDVIRHGSITCLHDNEGKFGTITALNVKVDVLVDGDEYKAGIYNRENGTYELVNLTKSSGKRLHNLSCSRSGMENIENFIENSAHVSSNLEIVLKEVDESLFTNLTASNGMTFIPASEVEDCMISHGRSSRLRRDDTEEIWNCVTEVLGTRINPSVSTEEFIEGLIEAASQRSQPEVQNTRSNDSLLNGRGYQFELPQSVRERAQQIVQSEAQRREASLGNLRGSWQGGREPRREQGQNMWQRMVYDPHGLVFDPPVLPSSNGPIQPLADWFMNN